MAKRKSSKKVQKRQKAQPPPQDPQDQDQPQDHPDAVPFPRFPRLRLSSLPGPLSFRLAGGRLKDED